MMTNRIITFHILLAIQFLLVAAGIFLNIKVGLFSMVFTVLCTATCIVQLSNDNRTDWKIGQNTMTYMFVAWFAYYILEILNPNNVMEAWNINIMPYAFIPLICAFVIPLVIRTKKDIELLLFIWSVFVLIFTLKGYWQKSHGFSSKDLYFLYTLGGWRTHIIWSGIRYFSCFSDAANFGVHAAMSSVVFAISAFFVEAKWKRLYFLFIAFCGLYCMGISGTRAAMGVIMGGMFMITIIAKNWKAIIGGVFISISVFCFFYFTSIGSGNQYIHKMRSSFHPSKDASYQLRVENRMRMKELMVRKPFGYGIGLSKAGNFQSKEQMPYPPDSWLISVWVETGIVGLIIYLSIHGILFAWCSWILMFKVRDKSLRGLIAAWLCMDAGFFIATYVNDIMQYPNQLPVYIGFALCFAAPHIDKRIREEKELSIPNEEIDKQE
nr:O-antigen ligase family protein [Bacteroides acidifaciens]